MRRHTFWYMIGLAMHINLTSMYLQVIKNADSFSHFTCFYHLFSQNSDFWKLMLSRPCPVFPFQQGLIKEPQNYRKPTAFTVLVCFLQNLLWVGQCSCAHMYKALGDQTFILCLLLFKNKILGIFRKCGILLSLAFKVDNFGVLIFFITQNGLFSSCSQFQQEHRFRQGMTDLNLDNADLHSEVYIRAQFLFLMWFLLPTNSKIKNSSVPER